MGIQGACRKGLGRDDHFGVREFQQAVQLGLRQSITDWHGSATRFEDGHGGGHKGISGREVNGYQITPGDM